MANTYTQIHIQCVFAVKHRNALIQASWQEQLYAYITGIVQNNNHKMLAINGMPDHLHMLLGLRPTQSLSDLMRLVKGESSEWINHQKLSSFIFRWQEGYGAFSYAPSQINTVIDYIHNQQQHHHVKTFTEEFRELLSEFQIDYNEQYLFTSPV